MTRNLQLGVEANWHLQYSNSIPASSIATDSHGLPIYDRITEINISTAFDKPIIAVSISTNVPVGKIWRYAGYLTRSLTTGLGATTVGSKYPLFLGKFNLLVFDDLDINYFLSIQVPRWFISANIAIYQYEGVDTDSLQTNVEAIKTFLGA